MPFQPINFANIAPQGNPFVRDLIDNLVTGYSAGQLPAQLERKRQQEELANAFKKLQIQEEPERFKSTLNATALTNALNQARINKLKREESLPFGGEVAPGAVGQAMWVNMIREKYGEKSPQAQMAQRAYESELQKTQYLNDYRNSLISTIDKRTATPEVKTELEIIDAKEGFVPGTGRKERLSPDEQSEMVDRLELKRQKEISDVDSRKRALYASNIDKTLDSINVDHLTQYAGIAGGIKKFIEESKAPFGKESQAYRDFQTALTGAKLLKKQVRQFYGDSITPEIQKSIEELTQPATWFNNPQVAAQNFNTLASILRKETSTYRGALKSTKEYGEGSSKSNTMTFNPKTGRLE